MLKKIDINFYAEELKKGNIAILSRAITLIESTKKEHQLLASRLIDKILPFTGRSIRIGITGVPGVGKSTFIESFGMELIKNGKKVAVLAIDPSSNISKGSILGDKTRMEQLSVNEHAFIRPTAAGASLGGLAYKTREATLLCEAAGFDIIIIETVGVGQSETEVTHISDFFLLLMLAGAGDELQGIKRGIMEMCDGMVITKADGDNTQKAKLARTEYARALHFLQPQISGWRPEVLLASAYEHTGISEVWENIEKHHHYHISNGFFHKKRKNQSVFAFQKLLQEKIRMLLDDNKKLKEQITQLEKEVAEERLSPYSAVNKIDWEYRNIL